MFSQNQEMCQHLADNVHRTMQHAIEVEEKIPLDQVCPSVSAYLSVCEYISARLSVSLSVCLSVCLMYVEARLSLEFCLFV